MRILLFCPAEEIVIAESLLSIIRSSGPEGTAVQVDRLGNGDDSLPSPLPEYQAVVIVYTPSLALSNSLFQVVGYIQERRPVGRFLFLPKDPSGQQIPSIFHPIRHLQMNLYFYALAMVSPQPLSDQLASFQKDWSRFCTTSGAAAEPSHPAKRRQGGRSLLIGALLLLAVLAGLVIWLLPPALPRIQERFFAPTATRLLPPAPGPAWLVDSFQAVDPTVWQVQHQYSGKQPLQETASTEGLLLQAQPQVEQASLEFEGVQTWPLDSLQGMTFSFVSSSLSDESTQAMVRFGLHLVEDPTYAMDCVILPDAAGGKLQCRIQDSSEQEALTDPVPLTPGQPHTVQLVFDPGAYRLQAFLDEAYLGGREVQAVEYWRGRTFQPVVSARLENLQQGSFQFRLLRLTITGMPGSD